MMILKLFKLSRSGKIASFTLAMTFFFYTINTYAVDLDQKINSLIQQSQPQANIGILVKDINSGKVIYQKNPQQLFIPASNLKLFTAASALLTLGSDFRYQTTLATDAHNIDQQQLAGNLYLIMSGDPSLTTEKIARLFKQLKNQYQITAIKGNVIVIPAYTLTQTYPAGTEKEDEQYYYGAPVTPFIIDENAWPLVVNPSNHPEELAKTNYPDNLGVSVNNKITTKKSNKDCTRNFVVNADNEASLTGCIGLHDAADFEHLTINNPFLYLKNQLNQILADYHIQLQGSISLGNSAQNLTTLTSIDSDHLAQLINHALKTSDNLYANALFMTVTQQKIQSNDLSWEKAAATIPQVLQQKINLNLENSQIYDGSGLSSNDRISPEVIVNLISKMYQQFSTQYEFFDAFPVTGHYGSLDRIQEMDLSGKIRAKTGSMTGVYNISGLLKTKNNQLLVFSIMINRGEKDSNENIKLMSQIVKILYDPQADLKKENDLPLDAYQKSKKTNALEKQLREKLTEKNILVTRLWGEIDISIPADNFTEKTNQLAKIIKQNEYAGVIDTIVISLNAADLNQKAIQNTRQLFSPYKTVISTQNNLSNIIIKLFYLD